MKTLAEFRALTADLPGNTPLLTDAPDHSYRYPRVETPTAIWHILAHPAPFEPDVGDDPDLYGHTTVELVQRCRRTVIVIM